MKPSHRLPETLGVYSVMKDINFDLPALREMILFFSQKSPDRNLGWIALTTGWMTILLEEWGDNFVPFL